MTQSVVVQGKNVFFIVITPVLVSVELDLFKTGVLKQATDY